MNKKIIYLIFINLFLLFNPNRIEALRTFPSCKSCEAKAKPIRRTSSFRKKGNTQTAINPRTE